MSPPSIQLSMPVTWEPTFMYIRKSYQFYFRVPSEICAFITMYTLNHPKPATFIYRRESCKGFLTGLSSSIVTFFQYVLHFSQSCVPKTGIWLSLFCPSLAKGSQYNINLNCHKQEKKKNFKNKFEMRMAIAFEVIEVLDNTLVLSQTDSGILGKSVIPLSQFPCLKY